MNFKFILAGIPGAPDLGRHRADGVGQVPRRVPDGARDGADLGETGPLSQGVQAGRTALRIRHIHGVEVRKKRPRGFK